ncbi:hypothetical protein EDD16DRAFT_1691577 [Pisolithus croceorrhizus]|nr:hypothetical protein EDD16DRAFT_1691577 [Pisolithus croceorrhizus]
MPHTSKHLLKAAATACATKACKQAGPKNAGSPVVAELLNSMDVSELHLGLDDSELEVWELEGEELLQSLGLQVMNKQELLTTPGLYKRLQDEKNWHLGYNGLSMRTRQQHGQKACEKEKEDAVLCMPKAKLKHPHCAESVSETLSESDLQSPHSIENSGAFITDKVFTSYLSDLLDSGSDSDVQTPPPLKQHWLEIPAHAACQQAQIQKQKALQSALEDVKKLICSKKNVFDAAIQSYLWMVVQNKKSHIDASECAAESQGISERWGGWMVHCWVKKWVESYELWSFIHSNKWAVNPEKLVEFSKEKMVPTAAEHYLKHITDFEMPQGLKKYMELELFPYIQLKPSKGISLATAHCLRGWILSGEQPLWKKGVRCGLHQSDVIYASHTLEYGKNYEGYWTGDLFIKQLQEKIIPAFEHAHGPGYQMLLMVDNSQGHSAYAKDALLISWMNMNPGGKQACMQDGWFICNGAKITQQMVFPQDHPQFPNLPKGMRQYLHNNCDYTFSTLQENMPRALASVEVHTIWKWEHRMKWWMEAYRTGLGAKDAQFWVQEFSSRK